MSEEKFCLYIEGIGNVSFQYEPENISKLKSPDAMTCPKCGGRLYESSNIIRTLKLSDVTFGANEPLPHAKHEVVSTGMTCMNCMLYFKNLHPDDCT